VSEIAPYIKNTQIYRCPSRSTSVCMGCDYGVPHFGFASPATRVDLFYNRPALGTFTRPAQTMMLTENKAGVNPAYCMAAAYPACDARHNDGANVGFIDGHAKWTKLDSSSLAGYGFSAPTAGFEDHPPIECFRDPFS
jgi:prepilin-type processing-associated H-X9-DG protein